jgi:hypothetical protein
MANCNECKYYVNGRVVKATCLKKQEGIGMGVHYGISCPYFEQKETEMACDDCKYWNCLGTGHCLRLCCSTKKEHCDWFEPIEQKGASMGTCKECKWWHLRGEAWGDCNIQSIGQYGALHQEHALLRGTQRLITESDFGCVHFEQKSKGPFRMKSKWPSVKEAYWDITFHNEKMPICLHLTEREAETVCLWLNEHWRE